MRVGKFIVAVGLLAALCVAVGQTQEKQIVLTPVKYDGLKQEVVKRRGKVLLVDFWSSICLPCMKALPKFIELQKKYSSQGFEVITVSVDASNDPEKVDATRTFLRRINSPFQNLLLDETPEFWTSKIRCSALPCYYLFDRHGKWVRFGGGEPDNGIDYGELEKTVVNMLSEK